MTSTQATAIVMVMVYGAAVGASLASFSCVVRERRRTSQGLTGRSRCACGRPIPARWNIPLVSWIAARGRTRCCRAPIPVHYLGWELAGAAVGATASGAVLMLLAGP